MSSVNRPVSPRFFYIWDLQDKYRRQSRAPPGYASRRHRCCPFFGWRRQRQCDWIRRSDCSSSKPALAMPGREGRPPLTARRGARSSRRPYDHAVEQWPHLVARLRNRAAGSQRHRLEAPQHLRRLAVVAQRDQLDLGEHLRPPPQPREQEHRQGRQADK